MKCKNCIYFVEAKHADLKYGDCFRYQKPYWVYKEHWCGEYRPSIGVIWEWIKGWFRD